MGVKPIPGIEDGTKVPFITTDQMREVDRAMIEDYGISLVQMMETAGRNLAQLARSRFLQGDPTGRRILVLAGKGGNGGGGMVCARGLHNWGADVQLWMTAPGKELAGVPLFGMAGPAVFLGPLDDAITAGGTVQVRKLFLY